MMWIAVPRSLDLVLPKRPIGDPSALDLHLFGQPEDFPPDPELNAVATRV